MARWRVPSNRIFRTASSRDVKRLEYAPQHEWDPQRISQVVGMVSGINKAATGIMGIRPLDALTAGISSLAADPEKEGGEVVTGAELARRAALARAKRDRAAADLKRLRAGDGTGAGARDPRDLFPEDRGKTKFDALLGLQGQDSAPKGIQDLSSMSFGAARRYARSTLGHERFKWKGGVYSTIGYEPRYKPRPQRKDYETDADWQRALEAARRERGAPEPKPKSGVTPLSADPAPQRSLLTPSPRLPSPPMAPSLATPEMLRGVQPSPDVAPVGPIAELMRPHVDTIISEVTSEYPGETERAQKFYRNLFVEAMDPASEGYAEARRQLLMRYGQPALDAIDAKVKEVAPKPPQPQLRLSDGEPIPAEPETPPAPTAPPVIGDPRVVEARARERARIDRIIERSDAPETPEARGVRISTLGDALNAGRIIAPRELPTNLQDLRALSQIVTDRDALMRIMRQARTTARPTRFSDLFTDDHERRAADQILKSFKAGERMRLSPAQIAQIQQRQTQLRQGAARLDTQERTLKLRMLEANERMKTAKTTRDRNRAYTRLTMLRAQSADLKLKRMWARYSRRGSGAGTRTVIGSLDDYIRSRDVRGVTLATVRSRAGELLKEWDGADEKKRAEILQRLARLRKEAERTLGFLSQRGQFKKLKRVFGGGQRGLQRARKLVDQFRTTVRNLTADPSVPEKAARKAKEKQEKRAENVDEVTSAAQSFRKGYGGTGYPEGDWLTNKLSEEQWPGLQDLNRDQNYNRRYLKWLRENPTANPGAKGSKRAYFQGRWELRVRKEKQYYKTYLDRRRALRRKMKKFGVK